MNPNIIAIGIDAPNYELFLKWLNAGYLPKIKKIFDNGASTSYSYTKRFRNERCWVPFLTGRSGEKPGNYGSAFDRDNYFYYNLSPFQLGEYPPFYDINEHYRICAFDLPAPISKRINGLQVTGWASELNQPSPESVPPELLSELIRTHGSDPKLDQAFDVYDLNTQKIHASYSIPSVYDMDALHEFKSKLLTSISRRSEICQDLLGRDRWDLFITLFSETHTANHILWHQDMEHPIASATRTDNSQALLEIYQAVDRSIGDIIKRSPDNAHLVFFTIDSTTKNSMDVPSMLLLPELLYRWNFPGEAALAPSNSKDSLAELQSGYGQHWKNEVWKLRTNRGEQRLDSPYVQQQNKDPLSWNPANWYKPVWKKMKAFALPSVSDGYIRFNVKGRESAGVISASEYTQTMNELCTILEKITDPRTGQPLVEKIIKIRNTPSDNDPKCPADLIVCWNENITTDALDSPDIGRIGPVPFFRTGGHYAHGTVTENLLAICGPGIEPGSRLATGMQEDLPATILGLMGANIPEHFDGKSLLGHE